MSDQLFEQHAAPEAIQARYREALNRLVVAQDEVEWLERLAERRKGQIAQGTWPVQNSDMRQVDHGEEVWTDD